LDVENTNQIKNNTSGKRPLTRSFTRLTLNANARRTRQTSRRLLTRVFDPSVGEFLVKVISHKSIKDA